MFLTMFEKILNIVLMMHISHVLVTILYKLKIALNALKFCDKLLVSLSGLSET